MTFTHSHTIDIKSRVGRNDLCPCGSGKKYKKCCLVLGDEYSPSKKEGLIERIVTYLLHFDWFKAILDDLIRELHPGGMTDENQLISVNEMAIYEGVYEGASPLAYFINHDSTLSESEKTFYTRWLLDGVFSFFTVEQTTPGSHLNIRDMRSQIKYILFDKTTSYHLQDGMIFAGRILPYKDNWIGSGTIVPFPNESQYTIQRAISHENTKWSQKKLMVILRKQRDFSNINEMSDADLKYKIKSYIRDESKYRAILQVVKSGKDDFLVNVLSQISHLSSDEADIALSYISELYNRQLNILPHLESGPKENELMRVALFEIYSKKDLLTNDAVHELEKWLDEPQIELGGRSAREIIVAERISRGNTNIDISYEPRVIETAPDHKSLYDHGVDNLKDEEYISAIHCFSQVDPEHELKDEAFRWYNNVGICLMRLGYVDVARKYFSHCESLNPKYDVVKINLKNFQDNALVESAREHGESIRFQQSLEFVRSFNITKTPPIVTLLRIFLSFVQGHKNIPLTPVSRQIPYKKATSVNALFPNPDKYPENVKPHSGDSINLPQLSLLYRLVSNTFFVKIRFNRLSLTKAGAGAIAWDDYALWSELLYVLGSMKRLSRVVDYFAKHPHVEDFSELSKSMFPSISYTPDMNKLLIHDSLLLKSLSLFGLIEICETQNHSYICHSTDTLQQLHADMAHVIEESVPKQILTRFE